MEENKIQTAEEFIKDRYDWSSEDLERWVDNMSSLPMAMYDNVIDLMLEFAKLHVERALKQAGLNSMLKVSSTEEFREIEEGEDLVEYYECGSDIVTVSVNSILSAYPESNIK